MKVCRFALSPGSLGTARPDGSPWTSQRHPLGGKALLMAQPGCRLWEFTPSAPSTAQGLGVTLQAPVCGPAGWPGPVADTYFRTPSSFSPVTPAPSRPASTRPLLVWSSYTHTLNVAPTFLPRWGPAGTSRCKPSHPGQRKPKRSFRPWLKCRHTFPEPGAGSVCMGAAGWWQDPPSTVLDVLIPQV